MLRTPRTHRTPKLSDASASNRGGSISKISTPSGCAERKVRRPLSHNAAVARPRAKFGEFGAMVSRSPAVCRYGHAYLVASSYKAPAARPPRSFWRSSRLRSCERPDATLAGVLGLAQNDPTKISQNSSIFTDVHDCRAIFCVRMSVCSLPAPSRRRMVGQSQRAPNP